MKYSLDGLHLTEQFEGCELHAYPDSVGVWTIGYGHTQGVTPTTNCTQEQAQDWLREDIARAEAAVNQFVRVPLTQHQFDGLVDFTFNLGTGALKQSTLLKKLNAGDYAGAAREFIKWDMAGGQHLSGLHRRRDAEQQEFNDQSQ